ncbi:MAG: hypothetical protein ACQCN6_08985 [Candidatus Bathyarchaeia archaeon]|jgi:hypothetical protein
MDSQICSRCVLTSSFPRINFDNKGVCSVCHAYDKWWGNWNSEKQRKSLILEKICKAAKNKHREFDALVPLSGGKDSTYVLYVAQKKLGLKCLAYTLDIGYLSDHAKRNVEQTCRTLDVEHLYYRLDQDLTNRLFALFLKKTGWFCSICMRAIQMSTFRVAEMFHVPLIIKGSSMRTELPLAREMFQGGDPAHVQSVLKDEPIAHECRRLLDRGASFQRRLGYMMFLMSGQKRLSSYAYFNLADYADWDYDVIQKTIRSELAWNAPEESEHMDCIIHPIQKYIHNRRFPNVEMQRLTYARLVMAGFMSREEALRRLQQEPTYKVPEEVMSLFLKNIGMSREEFDHYVDMGPRHLQYHPNPGVALKLAKKIFPISDAGTY